MLSNYTTQRKFMQMELIVTTAEKLDESVYKAMKRIAKDHLPELIREATAKPYLTKQEVMTLTGWSSRTLQNLRDTNQIPYVQHGHKIIYPRQELFQFFEDHHITPRNK